jgi:hypothetical protein
MNGLGNFPDPVSYFRDTLKELSTTDKTTIEALTGFASKYYKYWKEIGNEVVEKIKQVRILI